MIPHRLTPTRLKHREEYCDTCVFFPCRRCVALLGRHEVDVDAIKRWLASGRVIGCPAHWLCPNDPWKQTHMNRASRRKQP